MSFLLCLCSCLGSIITGSIRKCVENSLVVQWLRIRPSTARSQGSIPDWGTKMPKAIQHG